MFCYHEGMASKSPAQLQREIDAFLAGLPAEAARGVSRKPAEELLKYAQERANATGSEYVISNMGHVQVADAHNKRLMRDELGGIALVVKPDRTRHRTRHATKKSEGLPVRDDVREVEYHRPPTASEIRFGEGATHYRTFPVEEVFVPGTRRLRKWFVAGDDGLRYYR